MKAKRLKRGDTIALIAPSAAIGVYFPHRVEQGVNALKALGFKVRLMPSTSALWNGEGGTPKERGKEITSVFEDQTISGIVCFIGGLSANSIIPHIDYEVVRKNPKVFMTIRQKVLCAQSAISNLSEGIGCRNRGRKTDGIHGCSTTAVHRNFEQSNR